jgi:hypothetical protein
MKKYLLSIIAISTAVLFSCNKQVLNKQPLNAINSTEVFKDPALIAAYLTQIYADMPFLGNDCNNVGDDTNWDFNEVDVVSDDGLSQFRDWNPSNAFTYKYGNLNINGGVLDWWGYGTIREINVFIQGIPTSTLSAADQKSKLAEARFLRAFCYFEMVKRYGGVPLITAVQQTTDSHDVLFPKRATEQAIYDFIISELDAANGDLPDAVSADQKGHPSKYAALALESRAALFAGSIAQFGTVQLSGVVGIPSNLANAYYQKSYNASQAIIKSGRYSLYSLDADKTTNFRNIFLVKDNSEVVFCKPHDAANALTGGNGWAVDFFNCPRPQAWSRGLYTQAYLELAESFEHIDGTPGTLNRAAIQQGLYTIDQLWGNKDPRFFATLYTQGQAWKGSTLDFHAGIRLPDGTIESDKAYNGIPATGDQDYQGTGFGQMKYLDESHDNLAGANSGWATSSSDWLIFRYAETLLNDAEAAFESGNSSQALIDINKVRSRAGIAPLGAITRDAIHHERRVELAFESQRYWDVRRWRTAVTDLSVHWSGIRYITDGATGKYQIQIINNVDGTSNIPQFKPENYYLPITLGRTSQNSNLVENPGYK